MEKSPRYRILSFTTSKEGDDRQWFSLEIRLHTSRFRISVSPSNFRNSAVRLRRTAIHDCFDWAVIPCLADFERLSPAPPPLVGGQLTLSHFLAVNSFECDLNAIDDVLVPGEIGRVEMDMDEDCWPYPSSGDAWTTSFPSFSPTEIAVICDDPEKPFDSNPTRVCIGQQQLYFKEAMDLDDMVAKREVEVYEKIAGAELGTDVRTSRLYGIVRNEKNQLDGLLLYPIEEDAPLTFAVGPKTPDALKDRWAKQIQHTVAALHQTGITWGDAKPDNILIDVHSDAWITDFGGGRTEGWVDSDKAGTVDGDLQALERILKFIASGGDDYDKDCSEE